MNQLPTYGAKGLRWYALLGVCFGFGFGFKAQEIPPPVRALPLVKADSDAMAPQPVMVQGVSAEEMSDEQLQVFLQGKIQEVEHPDAEVRMIRVAPGYPLVVFFAEPISDVIVGDPKLIDVQKAGRKLIVKASDQPEMGKEVDTSLQVVFPGNRFRVFHVFVCDSFAKTQTAIRVLPFEKPVRSELTKTQNGKLDVARITKVIANYTAMLREGQITVKEVERREIFQKNELTAFTIFYLYRFINQATAITFSFQNTSWHQALRYEESRLRVQVGEVRYIPDYVHFHRNILNPGETTTGFVVLTKPVFATEQSFEFVWK